MEREEEQRESASPPQDQGEPAAPAGGGDLDEEAVEEGREKLDQAGGGH